MVDQEGIGSKTMCHKSRTGSEARAITIANFEFYIAGTEVRGLKSVFRIR